MKETRAYGDISHSNRSTEIQPIRKEKKLFRRGLGLNPVPERSSEIGVALEMGKRLAEDGWKGFLAVWECC